MCAMCLVRNIRTMKWYIGIVLCYVMCTAQSALMQWWAILRNSAFAILKKYRWDSVVQFTALGTHWKADGFGNLCKVRPLLLAIKALSAVFSLEEVAYDQKVVSLHRPGGFCTPDMNNGLHGMQKSSIWAAAMSVMMMMTMISNAFILHFQDISHGGIWGSAKRDKNHHSTRVTTDSPGHDITTRHHITIHSH